MFVTQINSIKNTVKHCLVYYTFSETSAATDSFVTVRAGRSHLYRVRTRFKSFWDSRKKKIVQQIYLQYRSNLQAYKHFINLPQIVVHLQKLLVHWHRFWRGVSCPNARLRSWWCEELIVRHSWRSAASVLTFAVLGKLNH